MQTLNLIQGTPEWHAHRATHFNASDAPVMMGISKYQKRDDLLKRLKTGITPEVDPFTQKIFNDGHRFEALARPLAEDLISEDLYPVTGVNGNYSASFDGITLLENIIFEHKTLNDSIRACTSIDDLDIQYKVQMEHQLMVSGASQCLFMATAWDANDEIIGKPVTFFYEPDLELRQRIIDGWAQLEKDLVDFVPEVEVIKPKAEAIKDLPAIIVKVSSQVVSSNLPAFEAEAKAFIANIKTELVTDQDFADGEAMAKYLKDAEENMVRAKDAMLAENPSVDEITRTMDHIQSLMREARLSLERSVKAEKENRKLEIINNANTDYASHIADLNADIKPVVGVFMKPVFADAIKGKKTIASMKDAVSTMLRDAKSDAEAVARDIRKKLNWFMENGNAHLGLFADMQQIIYKPMDDFQLIVNTRIANDIQAQAKREEEIKERFELEAKLKAEAEAKAKEEVYAEVKQEEPIKLTGNMVEIKTAALVEHQDEISAFLKSREFGKEESKVRAILAEFVKFQSTYGAKKAA